MTKNAKETSNEIDPNLYYGGTTFTLPNGDTYEGGYCAHRAGYLWREGRGTYFTKDGHSYEGEWKDDKLIEGSEIIIKYPNGSQYYGPTLKNKYSGPGTYVLETMLSVSCTFADNKPVGSIMLIDNNGRIWEGEANKDYALLLPENHFYMKLNDKAGVGSLKTSHRQEVQAEVEPEAQKPELNDKDWEKAVFQKSCKTSNDIDFKKSMWYQRYLRFKTMKKRVKRGVESLGTDGLPEEEKKWFEKYTKYKKSKEKKESEREELPGEVKPEIDLSLLDKFYSKEYRESSYPMKVFRPQLYISSEKIRLQKELERAQLEATRASEELQVAEQRAKALEEEKANSKRKAKKK